MRSSRIILFLILLLLFFNSRKARTEILVEAQILEYDRALKRLIAYGEVELKEGERIFRARRVVYDIEKREIFAEGDVLVREREDFITCERLHFNLEKKTGQIVRGRIFVSKGNYSIEGEEIEKKGENSYCVRVGSLTTCDPKDPDWRFLAERADVDVGGYAKLRNLKFYMFDIPVFFLPFGIFPVKTERESGLLMPEIRLSSRDGFIFTPYLFYAIDRDKDATFSVSYIEKRGIKPGVEFRYATTPQNTGSFYTSLIEDRKYKHTRYEISGEHLLGLTKTSSLKAKLNYVSDIDYMRDFGERLNQKNESLCKSSAFLESSFPRANITFELSYMKNLREKENDHVFKYLPFFSLNSEYFPMLKGLFLFNLNSQFTNFFREKGTNYRRLTLEPSISKELSFLGLHLLFSSAYYAKFYTSDEELETRRKVQFFGTPKIETSLNAILARTYFTLATRSVIKPQVRWTYIPERSFSYIPLIDPSDRIYSANILTYSISHYLSRTGEYPLEVSSFELEQSYGLEGSLKPSTLYEGSGKRFSDIKGRLRIYAPRNLGFMNESVVNIYGEGIKKMINELKFAPYERIAFSLYHTYTKRLSEEIGFELKGFYGRFHGRYYTRYSFYNRELLESTYEMRYDPSCWSLNLKLSQTYKPKETSIKLDFDLKGITDKGR